MSSAEVNKALFENKIDLGISRTTPHSLEIIAKKFFTSQSHFVIHRKFLNKTNPLHFMKNKALIQTIPCLTYGESAELFMEWIRQYKFNSFDFKIKYRIEDWVNLLQLVEAGLGFCIMPDTVISNNPEIIHIPIEKNLFPINTHYFLYHKSLTKFPAFKMLFAVD